MDWINGWLYEHRLVSRRPNRKYKVKRWILAERLMIWWINTACIRKLILLHFGYDPSFRNVDQSPFHKNEAGSIESNTITIKGALAVPLIENHASTRERWSLSTVTDSNKMRVENQLPGFEIMFKAEGRIKEARLQTHLAGLELPYKASVVTGASGSYKETDLLEMQEKWLEDWGPGRQWEIWAGDAYAAGLTDNVQRQCWRKGYISMTHGGGATGVTQTNDTELHKPVRAAFVEAQSGLMLMKTR